VFYYYSRHKVISIIILALCVQSLIEYLKAWDKYLTEKLAFDQFIQNAKLMAQKISDRHASAKSHKSFIDLGDKTIECEITKDREIFIFDENKQRVPLSSSSLLAMPSLSNLSVIRLPMNLIRGEKKTENKKKIN
jgi:hypothetical protein